MDREKKRQKERLEAAKKQFDDKYAAHMREIEEKMRELNETVCFSIISIMIKYLYWKVKLDFFLKRILLILDCIVHKCLDPIEKIVLKKRRRKREFFKRMIESLLCYVFDRNYS